jgi:hypothetical protein
MSKKHQRQSRTNALHAQSNPQKLESSTSQPTAWEAFSHWSSKGRWRRVTFGLVVVTLILGMVGAAVPTIGGAVEYVALKARLPGAFERTLSDELTLKSGVRVIERSTTLDLSRWEWTSSNDR